MASEYDTITLELTADALKRAIALLDAYDGQRLYPEVWQRLTDALVRRQAGAPEQSIAFPVKRLAELPNDVKALLNCP